MIRIKDLKVGLRVRYVGDFWRKHIGKVGTVKDLTVDLTHLPSRRSSLTVVFDTSGFLRWDNFSAEDSIDLAVVSETLPLECPCGIIRSGCTYHA